MSQRQTTLTSLHSLLIGGLFLLLSACTTVDLGQSPGIDRQATWVVVPFANYTETPLAGNRAETVADALLRASGMRVLRYPLVAHRDALFDSGERKHQDEALAWGKQKGARYALAGAVDEWRYKVGVDGEPAVGVTLQIIDLTTGETLWSGAGGKSGWSREALSAVAQQLINDLLKAGLAGPR